ncbi:putative pentatricopeptide repeat-containing protein At1g02420 [Aristolochia californica]|uniref:putative pentatricopeptide repeat-containing protein At1g02420 n=1 Tax=Aristolochia californica TaxID=171875 RepID=UPI0035D67A2D
MRVIKMYSNLSMFISPQRYTPCISAISCKWLMRSISSEKSAEDDVETIFRIVSKSSDKHNVKESLKESGIFLSNDMIDRVLKRVRFSHGNPLQALEFFDYTSKRRGFFHTSFSCDTMLYILGRSRQFDKVWEVLADMRRKDPSLITARTLMVVLGRVAKVCSVRMTVESFRKFRKYVSVLDTDCYNALFRTLCQEKSMTDARNVYHRLKREFKPSIQTFNILLSGWKSSEEAETFISEMLTLGIKPDLVSYNCLVDVYCKNREVKKAFELVEKMREEEIYPDIFTYTSIIGGLGLVGQPDKAKDVLKEMKEHSCFPDVPAYNAAIRNFCIAKRLRDAYDLMDEMVSKGLNPNPTTYNLFYRYYYWANDLKSAWSLYQRMMIADCLANTQSCMFLIKLFRKHEKVEMALVLWRDMVEKGFGSYTLVSDLLLDLLCDMGKLDDAERCFLEMVEKGQRPSIASFKRIKVLMELANRHENLRNLSEKMASFGRAMQLCEREEESAELPASYFHTST